MVKRIAYRLLSFILGRALPPLSSMEKDYIAELQREFRKQPILVSKNTVASEAAWAGNMNRLRELVLSHDPRKFLRWDVIRNTMFVTYARYISSELRHLANEPDWSTRWRLAIEESPVGSPIPYIFYRKSSGNLIHHAYHLAQFEDKTKVKVGEIDLVVEFGGGYGSMCRLFHKAGFSGRYVIYDLIPFSLMQQYYLKTLGFPVRPIKEFAMSKDGVFCVTDLQELRMLLNSSTDSIKKMFVGTWSISETPLDLRGPILSLVSDFGYYLIGYQNRFEEVNNEEFFKNWVAGKPYVFWHNWEIPHIPGSNYLMGRADGK